MQHPLALIDVTDVEVSPLQFAQGRSVEIAMLLNGGECKDRLGVLRHRPSDLVGIEEQVDRQRRRLAIEELRCVRVTLGFWATTPHGGFSNRQRLGVEQRLDRRTKCAWRRLSTYGHFL